jgi:hypothetical protein
LALAVPLWRFKPQVGGRSAFFVKYRMHPAAIQLTKAIHEEFLKEKGYRLVGNTLRYQFTGGCVISRLRGCSKFNRDDAPSWRFQIDCKILFDDLDYDPQRKLNCPHPNGSYAGGLYSIEDPDKTKPRRIAEDISVLTDRLLAERDVLRKAFARRIKDRHAEEEIQRAALSRKERETKHEQLPTGKIIARRSIRSGSVIEEHQFYGDSDIGIKYFFKAGVKTGEMYFARGRMVSRRVYEKTRANYKDMPPADQASEDWGGQLLREIR